jgi:hypothetical protein
VKNKYLNKKTIINGISFDSKKEAKRYQELSLLERAGAICDLRLQVKFVLIPTQYETFERYNKRGKRLKDGQMVLEKECSYYADFVYKEKGQTVVEDTKSKKTKTKDYVIKRKLLLYKYGLKIKEV